MSLLMSPFARAGPGQSQEQGYFCSGARGLFCTLALLAWLFLSTMGQSSEIGSGLRGKQFGHFPSIDSRLLTRGKKGTFYSLALCRVLY